MVTIVCIARPEERMDQQSEAGGAVAAEAAAALASSDATVVGVRIIDRLTNIGQPKMIGGVRFRGDGRVVRCNGSATACEVFDAHDERVSLRISEDKNHVCVSNTSSRYASIRDDGVMILKQPRDIDTEIAVNTGVRPNCVRWAPSDRWAFIETDFCTAVVDMRKLDNAPSSVDMQLINARSVYLSPSEHLAVVRIDKPVRSAGVFVTGKWTEELKNIVPLNVKEEVKSVSWAPNELQLSYSTEASVEIFMLEDGKRTNLIKMAKNAKDLEQGRNTTHVEEVVWSPDSALIAVLCSKKSPPTMDRTKMTMTIGGQWVEVYDAKTCAKVAQLKLGGERYFLTELTCRLHWLPDSNQLRVIEECDNLKAQIVTIKVRP